MTGKKGMINIARVRGPNSSYKIRRLTYGNKTGDSFGITVPSEIAQRFADVSFKFQLSGTNLFFIGVVGSG